MNPSLSGALAQSSGNSAQVLFEASLRQYRTLRLATRFNITPVPKPRMTRSDKWKQRPAVMEYWGFKDNLQLLANQAGFVLGEFFDVTFYIPMPPSWSQKKRQQMVGQKHQQKPDLDNLEKALMDCLASEGDAYIWAKISKKVWAYNGAIEIRNI